MISQAVMDGDWCHEKERHKCKIMGVFCITKSCILFLESLCMLWLCTGNSQLPDTEH